MKKSSGKPKQTVDLINDNSGHWCGDNRCIKLVLYLTKLGRFIKFHRTGKAAENYNKEHQNDIQILNGQFENYNNVKSVGQECGMKCKECTVFFFREQPEIFAPEPEIYIDNQIMRDLLQKIHRLITPKFFLELLLIDQYRFDMKQLKELHSVQNSTDSYIEKDPQLMSLLEAKTLTQVLFARVINRNPSTYQLTKEQIHNRFNDYIRSDEYQYELEAELRDLLDITKS